MLKRTCSVDGCDGSLRAKGLCYGHYMKLWRYGTPAPEHDPQWTDIRGKRYGTLTVIERDGSRWTCQCDCGKTVARPAGDLNRAGQGSTCGDRAEHARLELVEYNAAHDRTRQDRGSATQYPCADCGTQAQQWSYDHEDENELTSTSPRTDGLAYSLDPNHYIPRCVPCHKTFDLGRINSHHATV